MIPFTKTSIGKEELEAIAKVVESGWVVLGPKSAEFEAMYAEYLGAKHAVFVDSGTAALFLALKYSYPKGDENKMIATPALTFAATSESIVHAGLVPWFHDVGKDLCMLPDDIDWYSLPVHLVGNKAGRGASVYDSAHRIEKGDLKGQEGLWCYSFYATKNMTCVTGGMIATNSDEAAAWLRQARDHGLDLGTKERYTEKYKQYDVLFPGWRVKGDDFRAAVGIEQLKKLPHNTERRNELVERYNKAFGLKRTGNHIYHLFVEERDRFMEFMYEQGVQTTVHFRPLHTMTAYKNFPKTDLEHTDWIGPRIVSIPLYPQMTEAEQSHVINAVNASGALIEA